MAWTRAALGLLAAGVALAVVSGGSSADPRTPAGLPGLPAPFLGTAVVGDGGMTAAIDSYGDVVDLRPGPAGRALIDDPAARQAAGSVPSDTGIVARVRIGGGAAMPLWRADSVVQRYLPRTNVLRTVARFGRVSVAVIDAAVGERLGRIITFTAPPGVRVSPTIGVNVEAGAGCEQARQPQKVVLVCSVGARESAASRGESHSGAAARSALTTPTTRREVGTDAERIVRTAATGARSWLASARPLGPGAPAWARRMCTRSLLTLRALTDRRTGAVAAGARDGWAYVWPRDAGTAALAFAAAGYRPEARRVARFLLGLDLGAAARFHGDSAPVAGRGAQGDAAGWIAVAARAAGLPSHAERIHWQDSPDYQEGDAGDYLANAIAATAASRIDRPTTGPNRLGSTHRPQAIGFAGAFESARGLVRRAGDPGSGLDSAAAWAVRPFPLHALFPAVRQSLLHLVAGQTRFGIIPSEVWPGTDPWTAPTAWTAWSLAALGERRQSLRLLGDLRRASTPAGELPERVDAGTGVPRSTTPLAWSHAFAVLALRQLWPSRNGGV